MSQVASPPSNTRLRRAKWMLAFTSEPMERVERRSRDHTHPEAHSCPIAPHTDSISFAAPNLLLAQVHCACVGHPVERRHHNG